MYPRYKGPMIVIRRTRGGSYVIAEMNGAVLKEKVGAFRVLPHHARYEPIDLPEDIHKLIDLSAEQLETMVDDEGWEPEEDLVFDAIPNLRPPIDTDDEYSEQEESGDEDLVWNEEEMAAPRQTRAQKLKGLTEDASNRN